MVTDPPYGISFMGKDWDKALPSVKLWRECYRVLKYGSFAFIMCIPRFDCLSQMGVRLSEAGFRIDFTPIYHTFASGFPKASNIGKMVDKQLGAKREVIGKGHGTSLNYQNKINMEQEYRPNNYYEDKGGDFDITKSSSSEAKSLDGSYAGFQPKPAVEVIIVAMKPLMEKNYTEQALKNKKGVTWLDDCRIPYQSKDDEEHSKVGFDGNPLNPNTGWNQHKMVNVLYNPDKGRFPANLLVSDDVLNDGKIEKSTGHVAKKSSQTNYGIYRKFNSWEEREERYFTDKGSFSRYFSLDAWWDKRVENLPEQVKKTFPFLICPKASKSEKNKGLDNKDTEKVNDGRNVPVDNPFQRGETLRKNTHPTVKPIKLLSYLITLGSREGDLVLDPFLGSGSTAISCNLLKRNWVGIDINEEFCQISNMRLKGNASSK